MMQLYATSRQLNTILIKELLQGQFMKLQKLKYKIEITIRPCLHWRERSI